MKQELFAFLPPKPPQVLLSEPRSPSWDTGFAAELLGRLLQPLGREKLRLDMCPSCSAGLRSSPGEQGQTLTLPWERAGLGAGPSVAPQAQFYGCDSSMDFSFMGFSFSLQTSLVGQSSRSGAKCWWGCGHAPGRGGRCVAGFSPHHLALPAFYFLAVANIGPGMKFQGLWGDHSQQVLGSQELVDISLLQLLRGGRIPP